MQVAGSGVAGNVLHSLLEEFSGDIIIHLDQKGFLQDASGNIAEIGLDLRSVLLPPHITDLAHRDHAAYLGDKVSDVLAGHPMVGWVEFPILGCEEHRHRHQAARCQRWYALSLRPVLEPTGAIRGAVGLLRSVQQVRNLEGELHIRAVTDALTGLANRQAFCASLRRNLARGGGQIMAVLAVDSMRALLLRYGQRTADEIVWGFARFLETMILPEMVLGQLDGERFGVIMPAGDEAAARLWCDDLLTTFAALAATESPKGLSLSASAGLARVASTVDWILREAELGLIMAQASGGGQVRCGAIPRRPEMPSSGLGAAHR